MVKPYYRVWLNVSKDGWIMDYALYTEPTGKAQEEAKKLADTLGIETAVVEHWRPNKANGYREERKFSEKFNKRRTTCITTGLICADLAGATAPDGGIRPIRFLSSTADTTGHRAEPIHTAMLGPA